MPYPNLLPRNVTKNRNPKRFPHKLNDLHKHKSKSQDHNSSNPKDRFTPNKSTNPFSHKDQHKSTRVNPKKVYLLTQAKPKGFIKRQTLEQILKRINPNPRYEPRKYSKEDVTTRITRLPY